MLIANILSVSLVALLQAEAYSNNVWSFPLQDSSEGVWLLLFTCVVAAVAAIVLILLAVFPPQASKPTRGRLTQHPTRVPQSDIDHLNNRPWTELVENCVEIIDELDEHMASFDAPSREVAGHVVLRLEEILARSGVEVISDDTVFDRTRHKPDVAHAMAGNGAAVRKTLSPGFAIGPRVLRRARVRLG